VGVRRESAEVTGMVGARRGEDPSRILCDTSQGTNLETSRRPGGREARAAGRGKEDAGDGWGLWNAVGHCPAVLPHPRQTAQICARSRSLMNGPGSILVGAVAEPGGNPEAAAAC
jgi:hypothetical protein